MSDYCACTRTATTLAAAAAAVSYLLLVIWAASSVRWCPLFVAWISKRARIGFHADAVSSTRDLWSCQQHVRTTQRLRAPLQLSGHRHTARMWHMFSYNRTFVAYINSPVYTCSRSGGKMFNSQFSLLTASRGGLVQCSLRVCCCQQQSIVAAVVALTKTFLLAICCLVFVAYLFHRLAALFLNVFFLFAFFFALWP